MDDPDRRDDDGTATQTSEPDDLERASENVLSGWPSTPSEIPESEPEPAGPPDAEPASAAPATETVDAPPEAPPGAPVPERETPPADASSEHAPALLSVPPGYSVLEGEPSGRRRAVGIVVSRFNGEITGRLLSSALDELAARGVEQGSITVMPVPGAFELPLAAMALAKTRRFACVVALGCVIRGDTPHFDYVAGEAASGLQLAAIETGVPVAFGVLTLERLDQADARIEKGAEAVRTALEMADLFANLSAAAAR